MLTDRAQEQIKEFAEGSAPDFVTDEMLEKWWARVSLSPLPPDRHLLRCEMGFAVQIALREIISGRGEPPLSELDDTPPEEYQNDDQ